MESMETTYEDFEHGGGFEESRIPELTELADNNLTFSYGNNDNNGFWFLLCLDGQLLLWLGKQVVFL